MRKLWAIKEWRERRVEYLKGKVCEWCGSNNGPLTIHHPLPPNTLTNDEYLSFEGTMILCKRCAFAIHKGMVLCSICKKKYHLKKFSSCFNCLPASVKELIDSRNPLLDITCPCGYKTQARQDDWEGEGLIDICMTGCPQGYAGNVVECSAFMNAEEDECVSKSKKKVVSG